MKFVEKWVELENILNEATKPIKTRTVCYFSYVKPTMELSLIYIYYGIHANAGTSAHENTQS